MVRLNKLILYVSDMQKQVEFYRDVMGLALSYPANKEDYSEEYWVSFDLEGFTLALHGGGKKNFGNDAPKFVFKTSDLQSVKQKLDTAHIKTAEIREAAPGVKVLDALDPEGNAFSLESSDS